MTQAEDSSAPDESTPARFIREVLGRLAPAYEPLVAGMPPAVFWALTRAILAESGNFPDLVEAVGLHQQIPPPTGEDEIAAVLDRWAALDESGTIAHAKLNGLAKHLAADLNNRVIVEYRAWC